MSAQPIEDQPVEPYPGYFDKLEALIDKEKAIIITMMKADAEREGRVSAQRLRREWKRRHSLPPRKQS